MDKLTKLNSLRMELPNEIYFPEGLVFGFSVGFINVHIPEELLTQRIRPNFERLISILYQTFCKNNYHEISLNII